MDSFRGFARVTLRPEDKRRIFVYCDGSNGKYIGIVSLAQIIWSAKCHLQNIERDTYKYQSGLDSKFILFVQSKLSGWGENVATCSVDYCITWLQAHCHKSPVAKKKLKDFIADEWGFIKQIFERIHQNRHDVPVFLACKALRTAVEQAPEDWKVAHPRLVAHINALEPLQKELADDKVE